MNSVNFLNLEYVYLRIFDFFKNLDVVAILNAIIHILNAIRPYAIIIALILIAILIYSEYRLHHILHDEREKWKASILQAIPIEQHEDPALAEKWQIVQNHVGSDNQSDWRLAILEADIMLDEILDKLGFQGDSIGDKLKGVDPSEFLTLAEAKEAHHVRNQIAHQGVDYKVDQREAKRVISLYQKVFEEFYHL